MVIRASVAYLEISNGRNKKSKDHHIVFVNGTDKSKKIHNIRSFEQRFIFFQNSINYCLQVFPKIQNFRKQTVKTTQMQLQTTQK